MPPIPYVPRDPRLIQSLFHMDAPNAIVFARALEDIDSTIYKYEFPEYIAESLFPTRPLAPGKTKYTWRQFTRAGIAKIIADKADDIPRVDILGEEQTANVRLMGDAWGIDWWESKISGQDVIDIGVERGSAARAGIAALLERIAAIGDTSSGLKGITNVSNAITLTVASAATGGGGTLWQGGSKTPTEVLTDLNQFALTAVQQTRGIAVPDTLIMFPEAHAYISTTRMGDGTDTTILDFFLRNSPYIKQVVIWERLVGAGAGSTDAIVAFKRDPRYVQLLVGVEEQLPAQARNLEVITHHVRPTAGMIARYPLSVVIGAGY